ncbi:hypothetical protein D9758_015402 [Tetrapyrgos nigripes]|uniref:Peptidase C14 caspase domain-containing protein n=1 Tax=Tetrapyrgos nigripes TaxID=182062 RepID=A0A8H5CLB3_9AGAR|nr:hypothetical protein D9758_015402 [Tetrapyrgos nigripes]
MRRFTPSRNYSGIYNVLLKRGKACLQRGRGTDNNMILTYNLYIPSDSPESVSNAEREVPNSLQDSPTEVLEEDLSQLEPSPPRIIPIDRPRPSLFALIIGINEYVDPGIKNLTGAVADADSVQDFLLKDIGVPQEQIKNLRNAEATRLAIETEIQNLSSSSAIEKNTPILIFYAGHGAQMPAGDLPATNEKIEMLIPHDFSLAGSEDEQGQGILDVKLFVSTRGPCFKESDEKDSTFAVRSIELPQNYTIPLSIFPSHSDLESSRASAIAKGSENTGLRSHVLLAACLPNQDAKERHGSGAFTSALLTLLREHGLDQLTYQGVIANLPDLPQQNPQCEGVHQDRILFNSKVSSPKRELYLLKRSVHNPGHFVLQAGEAHGITAGAEFDIYSDRDMTSFIGSVRVSEPPSCFKALCTIKYEADSNSALLQGPDSSESVYALQTRVGERKSLRVLIPLAEDFIDVFQLIASDMQNGDNAILLVDNEDEQPDLIISSHPSPQSLPIAHFEIMYPLCRQYGLTRMPFDIPLDSADSAERIHRTLRSAAHFYHHLNCTANSKSKRIVEGKNIEMECFQLKESEDWSGFEDILVPDPEGKNLNIGGVITIDIDGAQNDEEELPAYGYKIMNNTRLDLYASLFYFDFSDLSIEPYFLPPTAKNGAIETPLPARDCLTIGYGSSGTPPYSYFVREGEDVDVGALKLFLSTDYVEYRRIAQKSPFENDHRGGGAKRVDRLSKRSLWDTMTVAIVQRKRHV